MKYSIAKELEERILGMNFHKNPVGGVNISCVSLDLGQIALKCYSGSVIET